MAVYSGSVMYCGEIYVELVHKDACPLGLSPKPLKKLL